MNNDHVHNQLCQRIEELEAEKLALLEDNVALAAHVESIAGCLSIDEDGVIVNAARLQQVFGANPSTSLARLKAQWQAEVLEEASNEFEVHERARMVLHWKSQKIRRQAEGGA